MKTKFINILLITLLTLAVSSCKKFVEIGPPTTEVVLSEAFKGDASATSAVLGVYINMLSNTAFENSGITLYSGFSADEFEDFNQSSDNLQFQNNALVPINPYIQSMWEAAYKNLVLINTCIEGLDKSTTLSAVVKTQLLGECKFSRAFINFYLVNLWGDVPLVTTSDWRKNSTIAKSSKEEVYTAIINDLKEAQAQLKAEYPTAEKVRPNKWAATALLARAYLYHKDYADAETQASAVIGAGLYNGPVNAPLPELDQVFLKESTEAIWQLMPSKNLTGLATYEGYMFYGDIDYGGGPHYILTTSLKNSFEAADQRKTAWMYPVDYLDETYFLPYKYKDRGNDYQATTAKEYYIMLRLSEQYMIRAEARAELNKLSQAMDDINVIRNRAGLDDVQSILVAEDKTNILSAIENENRHEFFAEWGHRWMDLKRSGRADAVLSVQKPLWKSTAVNFPIPQSDLNVNKNLKQNQGYN